MMTVHPAKTTARPDVVSAIRVASSGSRPAELLAIAGHDEEGVVNTDTEADHRCELGCERRHVEHQGEEREASETDSEAEEGGDDREPHCDHRPERDEEDDDRREEAEEFAARRLGAYDALDDRAARLDLHPVAAGGMHIVDEALPHRVGKVACPLVELHGREPDRPVRGDSSTLTSVWAYDAGHVRDSLGFTEEVRGPGLHRRCANSGGSREDDLGRVAGAGGEPRFEELERLLGLDVGEREARGGRATRGATKGDDADQRGEPQDEHPPAVAIAPCREPTQHSDSSRRSGGIPNGRD